METILSEIQLKLREIEEKEQIRILLAVESGSRAWGLASPDSDYDVRFIYVRNKEDYFRLDPPKDTIEWQLDEVLDINDWDLKKALIHFRKGNATLFEWGNSPIVYKKTDEWEKIFKLMQSYFSMKAAIYHYYGTAQSTYSQYLQDKTVQYKKYFYALRPLLACRFIEANHCPPPVEFKDLLNSSTPKNLIPEIENLIEKKKSMDEKVLSPQISSIIDFISLELQKQKALVNAMEDDRNEDWKLLNDVFFKAFEGEL